MAYIKQIIQEWIQRRIKIRAIRRRNRRLRDAIKEANALTNWDRKTRYVFERGDQFDIMSTSDIKAGRKLGKFARHVTMPDIYERAIYTATFNQDVKKDWRISREKLKQKTEKK